MEQPKADRLPILDAVRQAWRLEQPALCVLIGIAAFSAIWHLGLIGFLAMQTDGEFAAHAFVIAVISGGVIAALALRQASVIANGQAEYRLPLSLLALFFPLWALPVGLFTVLQLTPLWCTLVWGAGLCTHFRGCFSWRLLLLCGILSAALWQAGLQFEDSQTTVLLWIGSAMCWHLVHPLTLAASAARALERRLWLKGRLCPHCCYDLQGIDGSRCPECGRIPEEASV